jgi:hypothetical protein
MTTIRLQDTVVDQLTAQAQAEGLSLEAYVEKLANANSAVPPPRLKGDELDRLLDAEASADSTYHGSYPRADIYLDHD